MKSIFNAADNSEFIDRINKLSRSTPALWGKMNVSQMLAHCQVPIAVALNEIQLKSSLIGFLFGRIAKKSLVSDEPFKRNLPTFKQARISSEKDFDDEKNRLITLIKRFTNGADVITQKVHPFFGPLTDEEWSMLQVKHLDHHLRQFGV